MSDNKTIRLKAMDLLARREHSRSELKNKLLSRFSENESEIDVVLANLSAEGLQCDARFCESYIRVRAERGYGPQRLQQELRQRGVDEALISDALSCCDIDWWQQAEAQLIKKFGEGAPRDYKARAKRMRFLQYKGYSQDQINVTLATLCDD